MEDITVTYDREGALRDLVPTGPDDEAQKYDAQAQLAYTFDRGMRYLAIAEYASEYTRPDSFAEVGDSEARAKDLLATLVKLRRSAASCLWAVGLLSGYEGLPGDVQALYPFASQPLRDCIAWADGLGYARELLAAYDTDESLLFLYDGSRPELTEWGEEFVRAATVGHPEGLLRSRNHMAELIENTVVSKLHEAGGQDGYVEGRLFLTTPGHVCVDLLDPAVADYKRRFPAVFDSAYGRATEDVRLCPTCGARMVRSMVDDNLYHCPGGHKARADDPRVDGRPRVLVPTSTTRVMKMPVVQYVYAPGQLENAIAAALDGAEITYERWPREDTFDFRVSLPGMTTFIDAKDTVRPLQVGPSEIRRKAELAGRSPTGPARVRLLYVVRDATPARLVEAATKTATRTTRGRGVEVAFARLRDVVAEVRGGGAA